MTSNVPASVKARLLQRAAAQREEFERTLARYAVERFLYRLGASNVRSRCLLKGASLLTVWQRDPYRATRDVDLLAFGASDAKTIRALVDEVCAVACPEDGLGFDLESLRIDDIRAEDEYVGKRVSLFALLGKARIKLQIDIGIGDAVGREPEEIEFPLLLSDLPAPRLRAYRREESLAEKFEAMVKLGVRNSRMKDFHDVWALSTAFQIDGPLLQDAIARCFERRGTSLSAETPGVLTPAFFQLPELEARWRGYLAGGAVLVPPPTRFAEIGDRLAAFLGPVRHAIIQSVPFIGVWMPAGPWQATPREVRVDVDEA